MDRKLLPTPVKTGFFPVKSLRGMGKTAGTPLHRCATERSDKQIRSAANAGLAKLLALLQDIFELLAVVIENTFRRTFGWRGSLFRFVRILYCPRWPAPFRFIR